MENINLSDEQQIRQIVAEWFMHTQTGNVEAVLELMTDDAIFLTPGNAPMSKQAFASASRATSSGKLPTLKGSQDIQEIQVFGEWAYMWSKLTIVISFPDTKPPITRSGNTLTIFQKQNNKWRLARDANMLVRV